MGVCFLGLVGSTGLLVAQFGGTAVTIAGRIVSDSGEPLAGVFVRIVELEFADCRPCEFATFTEDGGTFRFEGDPALYAITANPPTPYNVAHLRVDARSGNVSGLQIEVRAGPSSFLPDVPPRASLIDVSAPGTANQVTVTGRAGSVPVGSYVIVVTLDTGHFTWTEAGKDGSFEATLFAPAGSSILIK
ncbi:hypothetical protein MYX84_06840, partial [Acidobacteria bacterium AH-259-O06]|nr:hypothetical protein [Acidobacteria bacterium AH-259-O06]